MSGNISEISTPFLEQISGGVVAGLLESKLFRTLETVAVETPARLAISFTDALDFLPNDCFYRELGTTAFLYRGIIER